MYESVKARPEAHPEEQPPPTLGAPRARLGQGLLGPLAIAFLVVAFAAPLTSIIGAVPLATALGDGVGSPGAYLLAGLLFGVFAVGYTEMSRHVVSSGAFYVYIARGLGRTAGIGAAGVALLAYGSLLVGNLGLFGYFAATVAKSQLDISWTWQTWSLVGFAVVGVLGYLRVHIGARLLVLLLVLETAVILVLDVGVLASKGASAYSLHSFTPGRVFSGAPGVALLVAALSFIGLEATAVFSEEARDPRRTIRRATYAAIGGVAFLYVASSWSVISAYGGAPAVSAAAKDPIALVLGAMQANVGGWANDVMQVLLITSTLAVLITVQNATSRYVFSLGRAGVLPAALGATHHRFASPHRASLCTSAASGAVMLPFLIAAGDPFYEFAAPIVALGGLGVILLQATASASVIAFLRAVPGTGPWPSLVAPAIAVAGLLAVFVLALDNWSVIAGRSGRVVGLLPWLIPVAAVLGLARAAWLHARSTQVFEAIPGPA